MKRLLWFAILIALVLPSGVGVRAQDDWQVYMDATLEVRYPPGWYGEPEKLGSFDISNMPIDQDADIFDWFPGQCSIDVIVFGADPDAVEVVLQDDAPTLTVGVYAGVIVTAALFIGGLGGADILSEVGMLEFVPVGDQIASAVTVTSTINGGVEMRIMALEGPVIIMASTVAGENGPCAETAVEIAATVRVLTEGAG